MIQAGELKEKVTIQSPTRTANGSGGYDVTWTTVATVYGRVMQTYGQEAHRAARERGSRTVRFKLRYRGIDREDRLVWLGTVYNIFDIDLSKRFEGEMYVTATEEAL